MQHLRCSERQPFHQWNGEGGERQQRYSNHASRQRHCGGYGGRVQVPYRGVGRGAAGAGTGDKVVVRLPFILEFEEGPVDLVDESILLTPANT